MRRRLPPRLGLPAVLVLALVLRVLFVVASPGFEPHFDAADYDRHAASIASGAGYPTTTFAAPGTPSAYRPPAWPYALGAAYEVTGARWGAARLLGALLGSLSVALVALVARELWGRRFALAAGGLAAVFPPLLYLDTSMLSEALFIPLMLGMVWACLRARRAARLWPWAVAAGVFVGLAALTRVTGLLLLAPLVAALWVAARERREGSSGARRRRTVLVPVAGLLTAIVVLVPWTLRNNDAFDAFVPLSSQGGYTLAGTYNELSSRNDVFKGSGRDPTQVPSLRPLFAVPGRDEAELNRSLASAARHYAFTHPGYVLQTIWLNGLRLIDLSGHQWLTQLSYAEMGVPFGLDGLVTLSTWIVLGFAVAGALALARRKPDAPPMRGPLWLWTVPVLMWLSIVPVTGAPRYRTVIDPFVLLLAGVGIARWHLRRSARRERRRARAVATTQGSTS